MPMLTAVVIISGLLLAGTVSGTPWLAALFGLSLGLWVLNLVASLIKYGLEHTNIRIEQK